MVAGPLSDFLGKKKQKPRFTPANTSHVKTGDLVTVTWDDGIEKQTITGEAGYVDGMWINIRGPNGNRPVYRYYIVSIS
jgi:hypothetical protein